MQKACPKIPTYGISLRIWTMVLAIIIAMNLGQHLVENHESNIEAINRLIINANVGISDENLRQIYIHLSENMNVLYRDTSISRTSDIHEKYHRLAFRIESFRNRDGDTLEDIVDRFLRSMRFISENRDTFTSRNSDMARLTSRINRLISDYPDTRGPIVASAPVMTSSYEGDDLISGLAYMDIADIPYEVQPSNGLPVAAEAEQDPLISSFPGMIIVRNFELLYNNI